RSDLCLKAVNFNTVQLPGRAASLSMKSRRDEPTSARFVGTSGIERHETSKSQRYLNGMAVDLANRA
ncbi:MAG: hypothetical protein M3431_11910, partial [Actinomycetota bacterium]|nr:hypothetical protein [Actinomycetota bacterium]